MPGWDGERDGASGGTSSNGGACGPVRRVGTETGTSVIDLGQAFREVGRAPLMEPDGIHPNATGHRIIAKHLVQFVESMRLAHAENTPGDTPFAKTMASEDYGLVAPHR